jgi:hypothetical protein
MPLVNVKVIEGVFSPEPEGGHGEGADGGEGAAEHDLACEAPGAGHQRPRPSPTTRARSRPTSAALGTTSHEPFSPRDQRAPQLE